LKTVLLLMLFSSVAFAQAEEFGLPQFEESASDAGVAPVPSAPPLPPPASPIKPVGPPPDPTWARLGGSASALFTALQNYYVGGEVALLVALAGTPVHSMAVPGEVEGFLFQAGLQAGYGRAGGPACGRSALCASRVSGGLAVKAGWARGLPNVRDSVARAQTMYFGQIDVLLSNFDIESAPLSPGLNTWELITRARAGLHFTSDASRVTFTGVTLFAAIVVEVIPVSSATRGVSLGGSIGIGF
jgi:hypothetical protein